MATWIERETLQLGDYRRHFYTEDFISPMSHLPIVYHTHRGLTLAHLLKRGRKYPAAVEFLLSRHDPDRYDLLQIEMVLPEIKGEESRRILRALLLKHKIMRIAKLPA